MENKYIVYKVTNLKNNKIYIGITTKTLEERKNNHIKFAIKYNSSKCRKFYNALRKYGIKNFNFEVIDIANNINKLCELEQLYIKQFNSINGGYNLTQGGRGNWGWKPSKKIKKHISESLKGKLIGDKNPSKRLDVRIILKQNNIWNNPSKIYLQNKLSKLNSERMRLNNPMKKIEIRQKVSNTKKLKGSSKGEKNGNYKHGKFLKDYFCKICGIPISKASGVYGKCFCKKCSHVGLNKGKSLSLKHRLNISAALKNKPKSEESNYKNRISHFIPVIQLDLNNNIIKKWEGIKLIEESLEFASSAISRCCKNKQKTSYGYKWRYDYETYSRKKGFSPSLYEM